MRKRTTGEHGGAHRPGTRSGEAAAAIGPQAATGGVPWIVVVLLATALTYARVLGFGFTSWDDDTNVTANPLLHPVSMENLRNIWAAPYASLYIPVVYTSYCVDMLLGGGRAWVFHLTNLALHLGSTVLVYWLLRRWVCAMRGEADSPRGAAAVEWAAVAGAALFALHPMQVESVAWITGRKDVLAGFLGFSSLAAWERWRRGGGGVTWAVGSATLLTLALLTKPTMVALGPAMLVIEVCIHRSGGATALRSTWGWLVLCVAGAVALRGTQTPTPLLLEMTPLARRPAIAADAIVFYLGKFLAPYPLAAVYGRSPSGIFETPWPWGALAGVTAAVALALRWRPARAVAALFIVLLAPALGFQPFLFQTYSTVADRYMYVPMAAIGLGAAWGLAWLLAARQVRPALLIPLVCGVLLAWAALAFRQTATWQNGESIWAHSVRHYPEVPEAQANLGAEYGRLGRMAEARRHLEEALRLAPHWGETYLNLALTYFQDPATLPRAMELLTKGLAEPTRSGDPVRHQFHCHYHLGRGHLRLLQPAEAERHLRECVARNPNDAMAQYFLGMALEQLGKNQASEAAYAAAERLAPGKLPPRTPPRRLRRTRRPGPGSPPGRTRRVCHSAPFGLPTPPNPPTE